MAYVEMQLVWLDTSINRLKLKQYILSYQCK